MTRFARPLCVALLSAAVVLLLAGTSQAQYRGRPFPPNRMPGWDWWRTYPWSPYNYGRNPYNPIIYPYVQPYPVYTPAYTPVPGAPVSSIYDAPVHGHADSPPQVLLPHPAGVVTVPPADAAVIRLYIPDRFGDVSFDGVKMSSIGTTRYYVTPDLGGKTLSYNVTARFAKGGQTVTEERKVTVGPGRTAEVDFR